MTHLRSLMAASALENRTGTTIQSMTALIATDPPTDAQDRDYGLINGGA